jgi:hypothetical protein
MAAIVTDQFRILNANNFVETVENSTNSYYVFLGLDNPTSVGFGRTSTWNTNTPSPVDNFDNMNHTGDTMMFGKKVTSANIRRLVRRVNWTQGTRYEMYRHDYSITNLSPITRSARLYDANYYVMNKNYDVYICVDNGATGISTTGNASQDEPLFTDLEPSRAGESGDGYIWKYLFTVPPSDIIKFDSTEYISVPNNWSTSTDTQIQSVRENGDSDINNNQIKKVYIDGQGSGYSQNVVGKEVDIVGDGTGAKVVLDTNSSGQITKTTVSAGGKNYSFGMVDLGPVGNSGVSAGNYAKLIPVIPPSKGHGYDLYKELGTDKILIYARFDDSTRDFPVDTKFAQIGIIKNPTTVGSAVTFTDNQYSSVNSVKLSTSSGNPVIGEKIQQTVAGGTAEGYIVSYSTDTKVLKYFNDRSLYFNQTSLDQTDYVGVTTEAKVLPFESSANNIVAPGSGFQGSVDTNFTGISTNPTGNKLISLGVNFTNGLASPEINKGSGEIIYLDNRPTITRNSRQKEDVKIILEF